jgi:hypothetical protein
VSDSMFPPLALLYKADLKLALMNHVMGLLVVHSRELGHYFFLLLYLERGQIKTGKILNYIISKLNIVVKVCIG